MKTLLCLLASLVLAAAVKAEDFFPIMMWDMCPADAAVLHEVKACGINVAGFANPPALKYVEAEGLKTIVADNRLSGYDWYHVDPAVARKNVESIVKEVGSSPAIFGYYLRDEPSAGMFPGLNIVAQQVKELAPGKWPYINLFPNYADGGQMEVPTYDQYVEKFFQTCNPPIVSYDHYALMDNGSLRESYWSNLESMRNASLKHHVPFWNIVLACAHFNYREPTLADLRFEAYSTMAYGGRGIAYFTYFAPKIGNYRASAIDQFGHKTQTWYSLQNVNLQIQKLAPTLLKLTSTRVYHLTKTNGTQSPPADALITGGPAEFLVGEFKHEDGSDYVMVVNKDVNKSHPAVGFKWSVAVKRLQLVSPYTGQLVEFEGEQLWLAPGQGHLLKVSR